MLVRLFLFVVAAIFVTSRLFEAENVEPALVGAAGVAACGSMIFFGRVWADYILPFGFWESFASDSGNSARSAPAIAVLGWLLLGLMGWSSF